MRHVGALSGCTTLWKENNVQMKRKKQLTHKMQSLLWENTRSSVCMLSLLICKIAQNMNKGGFLFLMQMCNTVKCIQMCSVSCPTKTRDENIKITLLLLSLWGPTVTATESLWPTSLCQGILGSSKNLTLGAQNTRSQMKGWGSLWESEAIPKERERGDISITPMPNKYATILLRDKACIEPKSGV